MVENIKLVLFTDTLNGIHRGDEMYGTRLNNEKANLAVSSVTYPELLSGLKTRTRDIDLKKHMRALAYEYFRN